MSEQLRQPSSKPVTTWLFIGVGMLIVQILLGGVTRLTGSGLSITEWDVITGTLPPFNEAQWISEFEKYKQTPQFHLLNSDFTLKDFKFIFFWEWLHRFWARLMGVVFLVPFLIFLYQKRFSAGMVKPLIILFFLGGLQGAVGWIMVASGLTGDAIYVKPTRLALHFILAMALLCYTFWFALQFRIPEKQRMVNSPIRKTGFIILFLLIIQLVFGALMAGHKAATAAPTWPDINGDWIPPAVLHPVNGLQDLIENKITIHFIHRLLAYIIFIMIIIWTRQIRKVATTNLLKKTRLIPFALVLLQTALGILSVRTSLQIVPGRWGVFEWMAQLHQIIAMFLLLSVVWIIYLVKKENNRHSLDSTPV